MTAGYYDARLSIAPEGSDLWEGIYLDVSAEWAAARGQFWAFVTQELGGDRRFVAEVIQFGGMRVDLQMFDYLFDAIRFARADVNKRAQEYLEAASVTST